MGLFHVGETVQMKGVIGQYFTAKANGEYIQILINEETKYGVITKIISGPTLTSEESYMIKYMNFQYPIEVEENYVSCERPRQYPLQPIF